MPRFRLRFLLPLLAALSGAVVAWATEFPIKITIPEDREPLIGNIAMTIVFPDKASPEPERLEVPIPHTFTSQTGGWVWRQWVEAEGYWSPERFLLLGAESVELVFDLQPAATVEGRLSLPEGVEPPESIALRFVVPGHGEQAYSRCPVEDRRFHCTVPAGELDPKLHAQGFEELELEKLSVAEGEVAKLGELALEPVELPPPPTSPSIEGEAFNAQVLTGYGTLSGVRIVPYVLLPAEEGEVEISPLPETESGPDGRFTLPLPAEAEAVRFTVLPEGYGYKSMQHFDPAREFIVPIAEGYGDLVVSVPHERPTAQSFFDGLILKQNGVVVDLAQLVLWAKRHGSPKPTGGEWTFPRMDPGTFELCDARGENEKCVSGSLAAGAELRLELP